MKRSFQRYITSLLYLSIFLIACEAPKEKQSASTENKTEEPAARSEHSNIAPRDTVIEKGDYQLVSMANENNNQGYKLELDSKQNENLKEGNQKLQFEAFDEDGNSLQENQNLKVGLLVNNEFQNIKPLEDLNFEVNLLPGNNVVFAYLIDEMGNSIKSTSAAVLQNFYVGTGEGDFDENKPHLFYIKPAKDNLTKNEGNLQLDFFLFNAPLGKGDYKIKFTLDEEMFSVDLWQSYVIKGLSKGKHRFRLQLTDKDGEVALGPFNDSALRTVEI